MGVTNLARRLPYSTKTFSLDPVCAMSALTMSMVRFNSNCETQSILSSPSSSRKGRYLPLIVNESSIAGIARVLRVNSLPLCTGSGELEPERGSPIKVAAGVMTNRAQQRRPRRKGLTNALCWARGDDKKPLADDAGNMESTMLLRDRGTFGLSLDSRPTSTACHCPMLIG